MLSVGPDARLVFVSVPNVQGRLVQRPLSPPVGHTWQRWGRLDHAKRPLHCLLNGVVFGSVAAALSSHKPTRQPQSRHSKLRRSAAIDGGVDALMELLKTKRDDKDSILAACETLLPSSADAVAQLVGDWKVEWSTMSAGAKVSTAGGKAEPAPTIKLRFLSFGVLPEVEVSIVGGFNRVSGSADEELGGLYELFQVFTVPGSDGVTAAMVLGGPWSRDDEGNKKGRASVHFQYVKLVPSSDKEASISMLRSAGLPLTAIPVRAPPTFIDVEYIDDSIRVHRGESGAVYVLSRETVPFKS